MTPPWRHTHRDKVHSAPCHRDAGGQGLLVGIGALEGWQQGGVDVEHSPWKASTESEGNVLFLLQDRVLSCREQEWGQDFSGRCFFIRDRAEAKGETGSRPGRQVPAVTEVGQGRAGCTLWALGLWKIIQGIAGAH